MYRRFLAILILTSCCGSTLAAQSDSRNASGYPNRPIRFIVPFAAGGGPDMTARVLADALGKQLGQQVVVDNRAGAGGSIGTELIARSAPDGYTIGYASISTLAINPAMYSKLPVDAMNDLRKLMLAYTAPQVLVVAPTLPVKSVKELIEHSKANPGKIGFASNGNGTLGHLGGELFRHMTATQMIHIPYKAAQQVITDVAAGQVQMTFNNIGPLLPHVKSGRLRGLAVTTLKRSPAIPELPTVAETVPGYEQVAWAGVVTPKGIPTPILSRLEREIDKSLAQSALAEKFTAMGYDVGGGTAEAFDAFARKEAVKWAEVVRRSGAKAD